MTSFWHDLPKPFFVLAPMEAVTDVVFRHVVSAAARPNVYFTEFTNATGWYRAGDKAIGGRLVKTDEESPIVAQLWGSDPEAMAAMSKHVAELGYDGIDINMGCPDPSAVKSGGGAGMIRTPGIAHRIIAAAKQSGLPVSVKTRLGYTYIDEWHEWLRGILEQDVEVLTIHLRTKKEMSKVPAHYELIPEIKKLRDEIAPQTLLVINGDIRDRAHGLELVEQYGVDGIMIGRGVFTNPFCFAKNPVEHISLPSSQPQTAARRSLDAGPSEARDIKSDETSTARASDDASSTEARCAAVSEDFDGGMTSGAGINEVKWKNPDAHRQKLISLLELQLDLFDKYQPQMGRPFETLKRFFKIYIRDFDGASELRDRLMHTKSTDEVRVILSSFSS